MISVKPIHPWFAAVVVQIAQLERHKQETVSQLEEEKRRTRKALQDKKLAETKLQAETDK